MTICQPIWREMGHFTADGMPESRIFAWKGLAGSFASSHFQLQPRSRCQSFPDFAAARPASKNSAAVEPTWKVLGESGLPKS